MRHKLMSALVLMIALGAAACGKRPDLGENVTAEDNMLIPADEADADAAPGGNAITGNVMIDNAMTNAAGAR